MVAQTRHGGQAAAKNKNKFEFREKLAGKGWTADALLKKLQNLYSQLAKQDQDEVDRESLSTARAELIQKTILLHKDPGVKAYTACCLAELLRLYAPDAPYNPSELRDIFQFFGRQLKDGLKNNDTAYLAQYFQLLESLSTVKSAVLVCDLPSGDDLMLEFFTTFFYVVRCGTVNKKMESFMADILVALLDECQSVPSNVLNVILAQFTDKETRTEQPARRLAVTVCNSAADKLQRPVCQYFTDIIVDSAHAHNESDDDDNESTTTSTTDLQSAHELIKRLHISCPAILHGVIPQLTEELRVDHIHIRQLATQALGEMYADKNGAELATKYPATWDVWLSRRNDKAVVIRLKLVESFRALMATLPIKRDALAETLMAKLLDPDDRVRSAVCKLFSQLDYESALHNVSEELLRTVAGRFIDKKATVRSEALNSLGKLYSLAYPEIEMNDVAAIKHFGWIPDSMLEVAGLPLVRDVVQRVLFTHILPLAPSTTSSSTSGSKSFEVDEVAWTEKLLNVMKYLSERSIEHLISLSVVKESRPTLCDRYLEACINYNGGVIDEDEEKVTKYLETTIQTITNTIFLNDHKASDDLHTFAKLNENRLYKLLKTCFNVQTDIKTLTKSSHDFLRRLEHSTSSSSSSSSSMTSTLTTILLRGSCHIINHSSIPTFLKKIVHQHKRRASSSMAAQIVGANAITVLKNISKKCPTMYKSHTGILCKGIVGEEERSIPELVEVCLQALANLVKEDKEGVVIDKRTVEQMVKIAVQNNRRQAKFVSRFLTLCSTKEAQSGARKVFEEIVEKLKNASDEELAAHVAALVQFARFSPELLEEQSDIITENLIKRALNVSIPDPNPRPEAEGEEEQDGDDYVAEWYDEIADIPDLLWAKIQALKVFRYRCINAALRDQDKALKIVAPVIKMAVTLLMNEGSMSDRVKEDPRATSRMRLQAALTILHLAKTEVYKPVLIPHFHQVAFTIQDPSYGVRSTFLNKVIQLFSRKFLSSFAVIFFLTVHDPEEDVKNAAMSCVRTLLKRLPATLRVEYFELLFVRLLHTLAHHPDFGTDHESLLDIAKYIQFYFDLIATSENVSLLYHLAGKGKTVRDSTSFAHSENFYMLCELSQDLLKARASQHSWIIQSYPGKVKMPGDILRPLPNAEAANRILKTTFLPDQTREWVASLSTQNPAKAAQRKERKAAAAAAAAATGTSRGKRKASSSRARANGSAKRSRKKNEWESDDDEEDEDGDEDKEEENDDSDVEMEEPPKKSKRFAAKLEEDREAREAKGLRTSARTRAKAQAAARKRAKAGESEGDGASSEAMETS